VINLAKSLIAKDISIQLDMIGDGYLWNTIRDKVVSDNLQTHISFKKGLDNNKVLKILDSSDILLSTSDIGEGWGFSIGEAMRSGCAVIASNKIGSVPYLIRKNFNGLSYDYNNFSQLENSTIKVIKNKNFRKFISKNAYEMINNKWNSEVAAKNMISLINNIRSKKPNEINDDEPLSDA
jgi:glycosyltransferase involved in cell wall biosynthesis